MNKEIEKAIRETLVVDNIQSIELAVNKILKVFEDNKSITRFEVIGENGRLLVKHRVNANISYQDDFKTMKVFISNRNI